MRVIKWCQQLAALNMWGPTLPHHFLDGVGQQALQQPAEDHPILQRRLQEALRIGKDPDAGRDWGQEEKGMTEDEMAGWYH